MGREFDAIVVGSGLGGLVAGALWAADGKRVLVLERNATFGGAAGTFTIGPLTVEGSLHELDGLDSGDPKLSFLDRLGLREAVDFVDVGDLYEVRSARLGEPFVFPHGLVEAREAVARRFPGQASASERWFDLVDRLRTALGLAILKQDDRGWWLRSLPRLPGLFLPFVRHAPSSTGGVMRRLFGDDEAVKIAVAANMQYFGDDPSRLWFPFFAVAQGSYYRGGGHYVRGGSSRLVEALVARITSAGGSVENRRLVTRISLDHGRVSAVEHEAAPEGGDAMRERAPVIFGNASPHALAKMLPPERARSFMRRYDQRPGDGRGLYQHRPFRVAYCHQSCCWDLRRAEIIGSIIGLSGLAVGSFHSTRRSSQTYRHGCWFWCHSGQVFVINRA